MGICHGIKLGSTPVLRMMIQQSNCFVVVERGRAMNNMMQERALEQAGEARGEATSAKDRWWRPITP